MQISNSEYTGFKVLAGAGLPQKCNSASNPSFGKISCNCKTLCFNTQKRCKRLKLVHKPLCNWYRKVSHSKSEIEIKRIVQIANACTLCEINDISLQKKKCIKVNLIH